MVLYLFEILHCLMHKGAVYGRLLCLISLRGIVHVEWLFVGHTRSGQPDSDSASECIYGTTRVR